MCYHYRFRAGNPAFRRPSRFPSFHLKCRPFLHIQYALIVPCIHSSTCLERPRRDRPPDVYGHIINVPTHFNVKLPAIGGHLPNADADSHLLVVRTCYNGQCKQMPHFRWSFEPNIARGEMLYYDDALVLGSITTAYIIMTMHITLCSV